MKIHYYYYSQHPLCVVAYHVTCGFQQGLDMKSKLDMVTNAVIHEVYLGGGGLKGECGIIYWGGLEGECGIIYWGV